MRDKFLNSLKRGPIPVFTISCWVLCLIVFFQLLVAGMALAARFEDSQIVRYVEKEVPKTIIIRVPTAAEPQVSAPVVSRPPLPGAPAETAAPARIPAVAPSPVTTPRIDDPIAERLVKEARQARVKSDMGLAVMKLEEALSLSPEDPNVHYEMGLVHEAMGVYDIAAIHFEKVFQLGSSGAGSLFELAAAKLRDGFQAPEGMLGKLALSRIRIFNDAENEDGQKVVLTIPVQKAPDTEIDVGQIAVSVIFFNKTPKGEIIQLEEKSWVTEEWTSLPFDWQGGEETLQMKYQIPSQDRATEHLFGERSYYGQVVSLLYKGEILDVQAWPRDLAARIPQQISNAPATPQFPEFLEFQDTMPLDFDPDIPLLPPLPTP